MGDESIQSEIDGDSGEKAEFVNEEFELVEKPVTIEDIRSVPVKELKPEDSVPLDGTLKEADSEEPFVPVTEERTAWITKLAVNLPTYKYPLMPKIDAEIVEDMNKEFVIYCNKKGINPNDYLFDEMPMLVIAYTIAQTHYDNYKKYYKNAKDSEEVNKLDKDFVDAKVIDDKKRMNDDESEDEIAFVEMES